MIFHKNKKQSKRVLQTERAIKADCDKIQQNFTHKISEIKISEGGENCRKNHQNGREKTERI